MAATWVVGVDGSDNSLHAVEWAIDQAIGREVRIVLLASWSVPITTGGMFAEGFPVYDWSDYEQSLLSSIAAIASQCTRDGVTLEPAVAQGPAAHVLIEASRDAALVADEHVIRLGGGHASGGNRFRSTIRAGAA